jgi:HK97 family phage major capsid protein
VFKNSEIKAARLTALVPVTEESLEDAAGLGAWMQMEAGEKMGFKVTDGILNGNGVGMPLGIMNAPCLVTVSKQGSQAADTLLAENVLKMFSRMPARNRANAVWIMNQDLEPLLPGLFVAIKNVAGTENVGGMPVYVPPGGLTGSQYGTLLGRPIVLTEAAAAVGDLGDIVLADLRQYMAIVKGGIRSDQSMHFWFDQNIRAFRFVLRMGGMPWLSAAIARKNGSNTLSHFVTLEAR